ncbi:MAG: hypothetical protein K2X35_23205 [Bryobacteraceae bacterium]|nr:hypothetical protein [Bryobacteraceae bacterium]
MAVYKKSYKGFSGALTPAWSRFLVLPRYSFARLFQSKFLFIFYALCFFPVVGGAGFIYAVNNLGFLQSFGINIGDAVKINNNYFLAFLQFQGALCYLLTALVGPSLVAPDLANGALPLYFCRPFNRVEYVGGKMSVLFILLSAITWIPGVLLFLIQSSLAGWTWMADHWWIATGLVLGSVAWILILSLIALACSAWVRWRIAAGALVLGVFFLGSAFGSAINGVLKTEFGTRFDLARLMAVIWGDLLRSDTDLGASAWDAWSTLLAVSILCVWLLDKKIRAYEVVKG